MSRVIVPDPRHESWGIPPLPEKITAFRPAQLRAIDEILWRFQYGARVVALDGPTGSGKTLVAEAVRRQLQTRALYMCVDRGLQRQFQQDFAYAKTVMGRANYPTLGCPDRFYTEEHLSCDDCTAGVERRDKRAADCDFCHDRKLCPYTVAKRAALEASLACVNTAYFLSECNGPGAFSGWPLVIADEGDRLEEALMAHAEVTVGARRLAEWSLKVLPAFVQGPADVAETTAWVEAVATAAFAEAERLRRQVGDRTVRERRELRRLENLFTRLDQLKEEYPAGGWVVHAATEDSAVVFKPVKVDGVANALLWNHGDRWLIMSATILDARRLLRDLGILDSWAVVQVPSTFPAANRPVRITPVADVTARNLVDALPRIANMVAEILLRHPDERILVHTHSYRVATALKRLLPDQERCLWLDSADQRQSVLDQYLAQPNRVLIAPALERGLDLPDDACRVVVICKVPYPDLGDPQVSARFNLPGGREWYIGKTLRSIIQMTGRGMRHEADYCTIYILDRQIERVLSQYGSRLPAWWLEAVQG